MSAVIADLVRQNIAGQTAASHALHDLRASIPDQDLLHTRLLAVIATDEHERLRAFMRVLQKRLEQGGAR